MKRFWICLLLILTLCTSIACQGDIPQDPDNLPAQTPQESDSSQEQTPTSPYRWEEVFVAGGKSSGVQVRIEDTNIPPTTFEQFKKGESPFKNLGVVKMDEFTVSTCCVKYTGDLIDLNATDFNISVGGGTLNDTTIAPLEEKYGVKIDSMSITLTINGVTHIVVEPRAIKDLIREVGMAMTRPLFDTPKGKVVFISRYYATTFANVTLPLSLFDFSETDCVEVTVNALFHAGDEVLPESFAPCTFKLYKTENGYQFVGTDPDIQGYNLVISHDCLAE